MSSATFTSHPRYNPLHPVTPRYTPLHPVTPRYTPLRPRAIESSARPTAAGPPAGREVRPVFLCKKDLDAALAQLSQQSESVSKAEVIVVDLLGFLLQLQDDIDEGIAGIEVRPRAACFT